MTQPCVNLSQEGAYFKFVQPLLAEFLSLIIHTFWGSMVTAPTRSAEELNSTMGSLPDTFTSDYIMTALMPAFQAGFAVWMIVVLWWKVCIINFNPAISVGFVVTGVLPPIMLLPYIAVQCLGSVIGAAIAQAIRSDAPGPIEVAPDAYIPAVIGYEIIVTGAMVFFAVAMVVPKDYDQATGPLAIGLTVFQGVLGGKWIGAGCMNPSRAFGPALVLGRWSRQWVWWVGDLLGGLLFGAIYMLFFAPREQIWIGKLFKRAEADSDDRSDIEKL